MVHPAGKAPERQESPMADNDRPTYDPPGSDIFVGTDGNAFSIMGTTAKALKRAGASPEVIDEYRRKAMSGDYNNLLAVSMRYLDGDPS